MDWILVCVGLAGLFSALIILWNKVSEYIKQNEYEKLALEKDVIKLEKRLDGYDEKLDVLTNHYNALKDAYFGELLNHSQHLIRVDGRIETLEQSAVDVDQRVSDMDGN